MEKQSLLFQAEEEEEEQNESILPTEAPVELAKEMKVESDPAASESATGATVGDEGIIEGAIIGENYENDMDIKNESDDDDEGVIIHASKMSIQKRTPMKMRPSTRPGTVTKTPADPGREPAVIVNNEELKKLRFSRHVTAFDVDINLLEDHPWRNKNVDLLDYFNYGFNERTWMVYCEKQLRLRAEKGLGPRHAVPHAEKNVEKSQAAANVPSTPAPAQLENQQQTPQTAPPQTHSNYPPQPDPYGPPPPAAPNAYPPRPPPPRPNLPNDQSFPPQMYPPQQGFMPPNMPPGMPPQPKLPPNMPPHMYPPGMMPFPPNMPPWMAPQMPPGSGEGGDNKQRNGEGGSNSNNNNNEADRSRKRERSRGRDDNRRDAAQQPKDGSRREEKGKAEDKPQREERRRSKDRRRSRSTGRTGRSRSNSPKRKRRENSRDRDRDRDRGGKKH